MTMAACSPRLRVSQPLSWYLVGSWRTLQSKFAGSAPVTCQAVTLTLGFCVRVDTHTVWHLGIWHLALDI